MGNNLRTIYKRGAYKERKFVNQARKYGNIAFRSAGSHSPVDVVIIDKKNKLIKLIQCKPDSFSSAAKNRIYLEQQDLSGQYWVQFEVL